MPDTPITITYLKGDATKPIGDGPKVLAHIVNDEGKWGAGFVLSISKRWPEVEKRYRHWAGGEKLPVFELGRTQIIVIRDNFYVANMVAQKGIRSKENPTPIRYEALRACFKRITQMFNEEMEIHMPRIGCGLAGGTWDKIEPIIQEELVSKGYNVFVYDYDNQRRR